MIEVSVSPTARYASSVSAIPLVRTDRKDLKFKHFRSMRTARSVEAAVRLIRKAARKHRSLGGFGDSVAVLRWMEERLHLQNS